MEKLVLIGPVYPYKGGISHYTGLMCRALRAQYEVEMVSYKFQYPKLLYKKEQKDASNESFRIPGTRYMIHTANPENWISCGKEIASWKPKAVIVQWWHPYFAPCYRVLTGILKKKGIPVLFVCHNVFPHERFPLDRLLTKMTLKQGSRYIVQSAQDQQDLLQTIPDAVFTRTPHPTYNMFKLRGISRAQAREELGVSEEEKMLLFFGFVREYKGLKYLLLAMQQIVEAFPQVRLYVVGDFGKDKEDYLALIRQEKLEAHVRIRDGYVPDAEVEPYFAGCDLVVLPYVSATQSGIVQIAYGFGKPVVVTRVGGLPEVVQDGETGYVVEPQQPEAIADAVNCFFRENKAADFAVHIDREKQKYSWEVMADRITELLNRKRTDR